MSLHLSGTLPQFSDYKKEFNIRGATVAEAVSALVAECPRLKPVLFDETGQFRGHTYRIFINAEQLGGNDLQRKLAPTDDVEIISAIAGG